MKRRQTLLAFALLAVLACGLRLWALDRDPPPVTLLRDEAPWTDEGTVALGAVNAARGVTTGSTDFLRGGRALHRGLLYGAFRAFGAGRLQGRLMSAGFGLAGLTALSALGRGIWRGAGALLALGLGAVGFFHTMYDRLVLTEGVLVALMTVTMLSGVRGRTRASGFLTGIGLGLISVGFKLHGLALLPALALLYSLRRRKLLLPFLAGLTTVLVLWRVGFVPRYTPAQPRYVRNRVQGELGLAEPGTALVQALLVGVPAYYLQFQLPLLLFASMEALALLLSPLRWMRNARDESLVAVVWLIAALVGVSAFRYQPARYFHIASPALILLALAGARRVWFGLPLADCPRLWRIAVVLALGFPLAIQAAAPLAILGKPTPFVLLLGLPVPLLLYWLAHKEDSGWGLRRGVRRGLVVALLVIHVSLQGGLWFVAVGRSEPNLRRAASALHATLPRDAIVTGRLAASLAIVAPLRAATAWSVSYDRLRSLAAEGPVWVLVLEGDERTIEARAWADLELEQSFPVNYSRASHLLRVYRFDD